MVFSSREYVESDYDNFIRTLTKDNMESLFRENFGGWNDSVSERKFFEVLNTGFVQLFFLGNSFVGFVSFNEENGYCSIHEIQVLKKFQRRGCGTKMMDFVIKKAKELNLKEIRLLVFQNNPSINFYYHLGFKQLGVIEKSNSCVMFLNLY